MHLLSSLLTLEMKASSFAWFASYTRTHTHTHTTAVHRRGERCESRRFVKTHAIWLLEHKETAHTHTRMHAHTLGSHLFAKADDVHADVALLQLLGQLHKLNARATGEMIDEKEKGGGSGTSTKEEKNVPLHPPITQESVMVFTVHTPAFPLPPRGCRRKPRCAGGGSWTGDA